jgi:hypothetical protein
MGTVLPPRDVPAIAGWLADRLRERERGTLAPRASAVGIERYHRRALAGDFARVFRDAVARARGARGTNGA